MCGYKGGYNNFAEGLVPILHLWVSMGSEVADLYCCKALH